MSAAVQSSSVWTTPRESRRPADTEQVITPSATIEWGHRENELLAIRKFQDGWDGFGADAPNPRLIDAALWFLHALRARGERPPMRVVLSPEGMIAIEWQTDGQFRRAEVRNEREVEWMHVTPGRPTVFETESLHLSRPENMRENVWQPNRTTAAEGAVSGSISGF